MHDIILGESPFVYHASMQAGRPFLCMWPGDCESVGPPNVGGRVTANRQGLLASADGVAAKASLLLSALQM